MVQGQQRACMPALHILEKVEIWSGVTDAWHTHSLTYSQTTEYRATQLVYSIKFKLSHATITSPRVDDMHAVWFWCVKSSHMILTSGIEYRGHTHFKRLLSKMWFIFNLRCNLFQKCCKSLLWMTFIKHGENPITLFLPWLVVHDAWNFIFDRKMTNASLNLVIGTTQLERSVVFLSLIIRRVSCKREID